MVIHLISCYLIRMEHFLFPSSIFHWKIKQTFFFFQVSFLFPSRQLGSHLKPKFSLGKTFAFTNIFFVLSKTFGCYNSYFLQLWRKRPPTKKTASVCKVCHLDNDTKFYFYIFFNFLLIFREINFSRSDRFKQSIKTQLNWTGYFWVVADLKLHSLLRFFLQMVELCRKLVPLYVLHHNDLRKRPWDTKTALQNSSSSSAIALNTILGSPFSLINFPAHTFG